MRTRFFMNLRMKVLAATGCHALPLSLLTMIAMSHMKLTSCTVKKLKRNETIASV